MKKWKILVTSAGSLVSQNILDILESRREGVELIATNSIPDAPQLFRYDRVYLTSVTQAPSFENELLDILERERPDLIFAGRDYDTVFLARFRDSYAEHAARIPIGNASIVGLFNDKQACHDFMVRHGLPFAATASLMGTLSREVRSLIKERGFPLLAKPNDGYGSHGVYVVFSKKELRGLSGTGLIVQELLASPAELDELSRRYGEWKKAMPAFFQIPEDTLYSAQAVLSPQGSSSEIFLGRSKMVAGRAEYLERLSDPEFHALAKRVLSVLAQEGCFGLINLQAKRGRDGTLKLIEMNPRIAGGSGARYAMGFDEIGLLFQHFLPEHGFPPLSDPEKASNKVHKVLTDYVITEKDRQNLVKDKVWQRSS